MTGQRSLTTGNATQWYMKLWSQTWRLQPSPHCPPLLPMTTTITAATTTPTTTSLEAESFQLPPPIMMTMCSNYRAAWYMIHCAVTGALPRELGKWTKTAHRQNGPDQGRKRPVSTKTTQTKTAHSMYKNGSNWYLKRPAKTALESDTFQQIIRTEIVSSPSSQLIVWTTDFLAPLCVQAKLVKLWNEYDQGEKSPEQLLRACAQMYAPVESWLTA